MGSLSKKAWFQQWVLWYAPIFTAVFGHALPCGWRIPMACLLFIYAIAIATGHGDWMLIAYTKRGLRRREREFERDKVRRWPLRIAMCAWSAAFAAMLATSAYTAIPATIFTAVMAGLTVVCVTAANLLSRKK